MTTETKVPETFTKEQVQQQVDAALAAASKDAKALADQAAAIQQQQAALEAERAKVRQEREAIEESAMKDDPDALSQLRSRRAQEKRDAELRQKEETLAQREARLTQEAAASATAARESSATAIAAEFSVSRDSLLQFTDGSPDKMRALAAVLPKVGGAGQSFTPDSGKSTGGGNRTKAQIMDAYLANPNQETRAAYEAIRS